MAKIRGFKPDLWTDDDFVEVSAFARLLWLGMWNFACDNGHLQDKSKQIKMRVLPTDEVNCSELIRELADQGLIQRQGGWISIPNLTRHQKIDRRFFTTCEMAGCVKPGSDSQPESRRGHDETTTSTRRVHDVGTTRPRGDGDGDGELMVMVMGIEESAIADSAPKTTDLAITPRADVARLCDLLADRIESNGSKRPAIGKTWHDAARLMIDRDGRTEEQITKAINWCQTDAFWRSNVLSMPKLREKYDQLRLQAERGNQQRPGSDINWDAAMERAKARDAQSDQRKEITE